MSLNDLMYGTYLTKFVSTMLKFF